MRTTIMTVALGAAMILLSLGAVPAAPVNDTQLSGGAAFQSGLTHIQYGGYCERLRRACEYGERGEGNCRRYREECGERGELFCERLRDRCKYKYELGEFGDGNCRRYHEECRR